MFKSFDSVEFLALTCIPHRHCYIVLRSTVLTGKTYSDSKGFPGLKNVNYNCLRMTGFPRQFHEKRGACSESSLSLQRGRV